MKNLKKIVASLGLMTAMLLTACGGEENKEASASVADMVTGISQCGATFEELTAGEADDAVTEYHYSVESEWYSEYASLAATAASADEIVIFKASSDENADNLENALNAYLEKRKADFEQYAPAEFEKLQKCEVNTNGNYVCLIVSSEADKAEEKFDSYFE